MSVLPTQLPTLNASIRHHNSGAAVAPVVDTAHTVPSTTFALQYREDSTCTQTVELPVWYGTDYNSCSMQTTTAPCFVSFPAESCHTARPSSLLEAYGISGSTRLWIVISVTIFLTMSIPVVILWLRWKLRAPRRGGKRSISVQLEKMEVRNSSKATSGSSSTPETDSKPTKMPRGGRNILDRLPGRNCGNPAQGSGTRTKSSIRNISGPPTHCKIGDIQIINNININGKRPNQHMDQTQHVDGPPPLSPRIALESLPLNHPVRLPENQPWMDQDQSGRWVPRGEGYLHPGLPPPPHLQNGRHESQWVDQVEDARRERLYVPGGWRH